MKYLFFFLFSLLAFNGFSQEVVKDTCKVGLPNSYSVNSSNVLWGINITNNCPVSDISIQIFNRWGNKEADLQLENGTTQLKWDPSELPTGTYFYILKCNQ